MNAGKSPLIVASLVVGAALAAAPGEADRAGPDVIVIGTGIAGLSAALEMARGGARIQVVDMWSVFGGHAVMSTGGLSIVGSATQRRQGILDSPELAKKDFHDWGGDADPHWVDFYVEHSSMMIGEWLAELGVTWSSAVRPPGNSVPRFHLTEGRGLGLIGPVYRETLRFPAVSFRWNFKVTELLRDSGRISGVRGTDMRTGAEATIAADHVLLATGGFQSNLDMVLEHWPEHLPKAETVLVGSGLNSTGSGHELARAAGAAFHRMDHQWNYARGLPHPAYPGDGRGLNVSVTESIWVNAQAERFVNERASTKVVFPALVKQEPATYWAIFDEGGKRSMGVSGSGWQEFGVVQREILDNPDIVQKAATLAELGAKIGLDPAALEQSVRRYNDMLERGADEDFGRFDQDDEFDPSILIAEAPFYAAQFFPLTRKSMGGIRIDSSARVVAGSGEPILGLYAAGEATGMAGINGRAGLEGTFLGPSLLTGRVAGRSILASIEASRELSPAHPVTPDPPEMPAAAASAVDLGCEDCHAIPELLRQHRPGFAHFERVHRIVQERSLACDVCHADLQPYIAGRHDIDRIRQVEVCRNCHLAVEQVE